MSANVHAAAAIRDIPASCTCPWAWSDWLSRYMRTDLSRSCGWHSQHVRRPAA